MPRVGRPSLTEGEQRQVVSISLTTNLVWKLDQLADNRSEFIRDAIEAAWAERQQAIISFLDEITDLLDQEQIQALKERAGLDDSSDLLRVVSPACDDLLSLSPEEHPLVNLLSRY